MWPRRRLRRQRHPPRGRALPWERQQINSRRKRANDIKRYSQSEREIQKELRFNNKQFGTLMNDPRFNQVPTFKGGYFSSFSIFQRQKLRDPTPHLSNTPTHACSTDKHWPTPPCKTSNKRKKKKHFHLPTCKRGEFTHCVVTSNIFPRSCHDISRF